MRPAKIAILAVAMAAVIPAAQAADFMGGGADPIYNSSLFNFEGFYVGGTGGVGAFQAPGVVGSVGVVAGANFELTDAILAGVEFQGDTLWNSLGFVGFDALFLAKLGSYLADDIMVYGNAGAGWVDDTPSYAFGAGLEWAITDAISVRGEVMGTGSFGSLPNGAKATVGVLWHMN